MAETAGALLGPREGQTVNGKYRLLRKLGEGGMGEVYYATHLGIGRPFALKFLHAHLARSAEFVDRFHREARSAGSLVDENIVSVTDFGVAEDGAPYIVMEHLEGENLSHLLMRNGSLPVSRAVFLIIQACRGLAQAHAMGIIHRDLKPENLFICKRNDGSDLLKILDFGIAKLRTSTGITRTGIAIGTPYYMSPEQARGAKDIDNRTDIYALGAILFETLSGQKPHPGDEFLGIVHHVLNEKSPPLDAIVPELPVGLPDVVGKAMAFEARDRFATVRQLMDALIPFAGRAITPMRTELVPQIEEQMVRLAKTTPIEPSRNPGEAGMSHPPKATRTVELGSRRRVLYGVAAAIASLALGSIGWFLVHQPSAPPDQPAATVTAPVPATPPASRPPTEAVEPLLAAPLGESLEAEHPGPGDVPRLPHGAASVGTVATAPRSPRPAGQGDKQRETGHEKAVAETRPKTGITPHRLVRPLDESNPFLRTSEKASARRPRNAP